MRAITIFFLLTLNLSLKAQYATTGTGILKNKIWWFDWNGVALSNGVTKTFNTDDGLKVTITISNVVNPILVPSVMNTWSGSVLHLLYNFTDTNIKPALFKSDATGGVSNIQFTMSITATRNGLPTPITFVAADAEASSAQETSIFTTNGSSWTTLEFFRNSSQTIDPLSGCGTSTVRLNNTYGGAPTTGQNPILATTSPNGELTINTTLENFVSGGMAVAFGIFSAVDRGDLPSPYGLAVHRLLLSSINGCSHTTPFPSTFEDTRLSLGTVPPDADNVQSTDDNLSGADEDAIVTFPKYDKSGSYTLGVTVVNTTGNDAYLTGWFDYDRSGTFNNGESVTVTVPANSTVAHIAWTGLPTNLPAGSVQDFGFRLRLSSNKSDTQSPDGPARDGEVEDYLAQVFYPLAAFTAPDTVCVDAPINIVNQSSNASSYHWNFCLADINNNTPEAVNLGNPGNTLSLPSFMEIASDNGKYYAFISNHSGSLARLDFGTSLLNTPVATNLGSFGGMYPVNAQGLQVVKDDGKWYVIAAGGNPTIGNPSRIVKIELGPYITNNSPVLTNWGNIGGLYNPMELHLFEENNNWWGFTINSENNTITQLSFGSSFDNIPTGVNLGNIGSINHPAGINVINDNGFWRAFIPNSHGSTITRLDFGSSLSNIPVGFNLGNPGNVLNDPRDITIIKYCSDSIVGFVMNGESAPALVRLNFTAGLSSIPVATNLGNIGNLNFPHSITRLQRIESDLYFFVTNVRNNTITRFKISGQCIGVSASSSTDEHPSAISYSKAGVYNINLTVNEGMPNQASYCKEIVVLSSVPADFSFFQDICNPQAVKLKNESTNHVSLSWDFGNTSTSTEETPTALFNTFGTYAIKLKTLAYGGCADSITKQIPVMITIDSVITTRDTSVCFTGNFQLNALPALSYCWSPGTGLSGTDIANPVVSGLTPGTTYRLNAFVTGKNLIANGDFSQGNTGFTSRYQFSGSNTSEGQYFVGTNPKTWNNSINACGDHTSGNGNMLLVNGNPVADEAIWSQTINVTPSTNYAFSTWIQSISDQNPAQLQFSINGTDMADLISATSPSCNWKQFYATWNSGNKTTAVISIINKNIIRAGNDFALDDISFGPLVMVRDSVTVAINANPEVDFNYNIPFCKSVQMTGMEVSGPSPIADWKWSFGDNLSASSPTLTHNYKNGGKYTIKVLATDMNSCKDSIEKIIQLDTIIAVVSPDTIVCKNTPVTLRGSGGTIYEWSPVNFMNSANDPEPVVSVAQTTRFHLKVKNGIGCEDTDSVLVSIKPRPAFIKPPDRAVCADSSIQLKGNNGNAHNYLWSPAGTLDNPAAANPIATPLGNTRYQVTVTEVPCGYDTTFEISVIVNPNPSVIASKQRDIDCINPTTRLTAEGTGLKYEWSPAYGVDYPTSSIVLGSADSTTTFIVKNTNQYNCSAYDSVIVKVTNTAKPVFVLPNAFTPNKDGINDCFGIKHWGNVVIHEFSIFNRWGERVFTTKNPRDCWDGMYKGQLQPSGGYLYTIRAMSFCGEMIRKGSLMLVR